MNKRTIFPTAIILLLLSFSYVFFRDHGRQTHSKLEVFSGQDQSSIPPRQAVQKTRPDTQRPMDQRAQIVTLAEAVEINGDMGSTLSELHDDEIPEDNVEAPALVTRAGVWELQKIPSSNGNCSMASECSPKARDGVLMLGTSMLLAQQNSGWAGVMELGRYENRTPLLNIR